MLYSPRSIRLRSSGNVFQGFSDFAGSRETTSFCEGFRGTLRCDFERLVAAEHDAVWALQLPANALFSEDPVEVAFKLVLLVWSILE